MSSNRFKDTLRQIRADSETRSAAGHRDRSDAELARSDRTVHAFEFRERVEAVIEEYVQNFQAEAPGFGLTRGFFEGKYMLALRCHETLVDSDGFSDRYFSRVMFLLSPDVEAGTFAMQCRTTVRNIDHETATCSGELDEIALPIFTSFIEEQFLAFAGRYFADSDLTRPGAENEQPTPTPAS